jgi:hypothetical protein
MKLCFPKGFPPTTVCNVNVRRTSQGRHRVGKRDELIAKYAEDLKNKCKVTPDMALLTKVTIGCGPAIYDNDAQTVAASDSAELDRIKSNFLIKKLGLKDGPALMDGINAAVDTYGKSERNKFRAVFYYLLVKHFGREAAYK